MDINYTKMRTKTIAGEYLLRIHHAQSASSLVWTGNEATSGFSAPKPSFKNMSKQVYEAHTRNMVHTDWANGPIMKRLMINHVLQRIPAGPAYYGTFSEDKALDESRDKEKEKEMERERDEMISPFISTMRYLDWALYRIVHLLVWTNLEEVHLTIIKNPLRDSTSSGQVSNAENVKEVITAPFIGKLEDYMSGLDEREKEETRMAKERVKENMEILFYGRIFGSSINHDLVFTKANLPFNLPAQFWRPLKYKGNGNPGWLNRLRWDPKEDSWRDVQRKINWDIKYDLPTYWANQPVFLNIPPWPPGNIRPMIGNERSMIPEVKVSLPTKTFHHPFTSRPSLYRPIQPNPTRGRTRMTGSHMTSSSSQRGQLRGSLPYRGSSRGRGTGFHRELSRSRNRYIVPLHLRNAQTTPLVGTQVNQEVSYYDPSDFMGPEEFERRALEDSEAMLINLQL